MTNHSSATATALGAVKSTSRGTAVIEVASDVCPRCAAGKGCGAGLIAGRRKSLSVTLPLPVDLDLSAGDAVQLSIPSGTLLRAASCLYGLPLAGLLVGACSALVAGAGDIPAAVAAAAGIFAGLVSGRRMARRDPCLSSLSPVVSARIGIAAVSTEGIQRS